MNNLEYIKSKILRDTDIGSMLAYWKFKNYRVVFTNGL